MARDLAREGRPRGRVVQRHLAGDAAARAPRQELRGPPARDRDDADLRPLEVEGGCERDLVAQAATAARGHAPLTAGRAPVRTARAGRWWGGPAGSDPARPSSGWDSRSRQRPAAAPPARG